MSDFLSLISGEMKDDNSGKLHEDILKASTIEFEKYREKTKKSIDFLLSKVKIRSVDVKDEDLQIDEANLMGELSRFAVMASHSLDDSRDISVKVKLIEIIKDDYLVEMEKYLLKRKKYRKLSQNELRKKIFSDETYSYIVLRINHLNIYHEKCMHRFHLINKIVSIIAKETWSD